VGEILIDHWLGTGDRIAIVDDASISEVREAVRACGRGAGLAADAYERLAAGASELAHNQLAYAVRGMIVVRQIERAGVVGVEVAAADRGRGIPDPDTALAGARRVSGSLGVGLSAAARQTDEIDVDTREGTGTCVRVRSFAARVRKSEVGVIARPHPDESVIGDHAVHVRSGDTVTIAVADGLGHGVLAREAADRALAEVVARPTRRLEDLLAGAHAALAGTRGAVMAIARVDGGGGIDHASIGNIGSRIIAPDGRARALGSVAGTLGIAYPRRLPVERVQLAPDELLVLFSDGLASRLDLVADPMATRRHPCAVAQRLLALFARGTDDALIAVVR
jgi:anti-sigma regulatory factor (Ser/Thr protein kinase)